MPRRRIANAIKDKGTSKARTRAIADRAKPRGEHKPVRQTVTGQGGSRKGNGDPDVLHPSQMGGVKAEDRERLVIGKGGTARPGRRSGSKRPGSPGLIKAPGRSRLKDTRTVGGRTRSGRDRGGPQARGPARRGTRTRGR